MPNWFEPTIVLFPYAAWIFLGMGIPWALAVLPRRLWRERIVVLALGMALGPVLYTAWMFVLGTWGRITFANTLIGSVALAALGAGWVVRRMRTSQEPVPAHPATATELPPAPLTHTLATRVIVLGIAVLVGINIVVTAYWPFIAYDAQWVYGYNARIFVLEDRIPDEMGYYPQLVPLSYTTMQQAWGALGYEGLFDSPINDHAARVVVPWFNLASILMAYVLGLFTWRDRRAALITAAVWAFYPHMAAWGNSGDLEITLTLYVTGAAAFFVAAWRADSIRLAVISGLLLSGALWTKPTGGALALGVMLAVGGALVRRRFDWRAWWPKFRLAMAAGVASAPLGGMWYLRNALLGHTAIVFPADYWHDFAQRSGQELGWPLLLAGLLAGALLLAPRWRLGEFAERDLTPQPPLQPPERGGKRRVESPLRVWRGDLGVRLNPQNSQWLRFKNAVSHFSALSLHESPTWVRILPLVAVALMLIGALPSALANVDATGDVWRWARGDVTSGPRMGWLEWLPVVVGAVMLLWAARDAWRQLEARWRDTLLLIWALMLPYAVVWFLSFSYHYRLSFAIVPLAAVQVAGLIDGWLWEWFSVRRVGRAAGIVLLVGLITLAGAAALEHTASAWRSGESYTDVDKYDMGNPGTMVVVHMLERYAAEHEGSGPGGTPVVVIPGEDRLPFFFPTWEIRNSRELDELPTRLEDLAGVDVFVNNSVGVFLMQLAGKWPNSLQAEADVATIYHTLDVQVAGERWPTVLEPIPLSADGSVHYDDGNFRYSAFTIHPEARYAELTPNAPAEDTVLFGDFAQYVGLDVVTLNWQRGHRIVLLLHWQATEDAPPNRDYSVYVHLMSQEGEWLAGWDSAPMQGAYSTRFWRPGESVLDYRVFSVPDDIPAGPAYVRIGIYDPLTGERVPVTVDGELVGDGLTVLPLVTVQ